MSSNRPVFKVIDELNYDALRSLVDKECVAVLVRGFCSKGIADDIADWADRDPRRTNYPVFESTRGLIPSTTEKLGSTLNELIPGMIAESTSIEDQTQASIRSVQIDELKGLHFQNDLRRLYPDRLLPVDKLRIVLDELWPTGAGIARFGDRSVCPGVIRILKAQNDDGNDPHIDVLPSRIRRIAIQLSAIVYLRLPKTGGGLEIWNVKRDFLSEYLCNDGTIDRRVLPPPIEITPDCGDLVIINSRLPHAVTPFVCGPRIAQCCFIGLESRVGTMMLWS